MILELIREFFVWNVLITLVFAFPVGIWKSICRDNQWDFDADMREIRQMLMVVLPLFVVLCSTLILVNNLVR